MEKLREQEEKENSLQRKKYGRYAAAAATVLLLLYYCRHPELYAPHADEIPVFILKSGRTYAVMLISFLLLMLALTPVQLDKRKNRILSGCWFVLAPVAIYFSLLYLNADKFQIHFFELNRIALVFTFLFLYLAELIFVVVTGSIRFSAVILAVLVAVLGIANCFVIEFRGMALSAADLFSVGTAMAVADEYTYRLDWYMYMEILCTFAICMVSLKLSGGRILRPVQRYALFALWIVLSGGYYYVCCETDYLERHDIRSLGFTHQLRYKEYDMLFTTLTTCFYLSADKPEGYSARRVKEIAEPYLAEEEEEENAGEDTYATVTYGANERNDKQIDDTNERNDRPVNDTYAGVINKEEKQARPNIIVIMNESFADYSDIGRGLTLSEDCMPFLHSMKENTIRGSAYASIFGGNTPNSEYEFLTGNTMAFLPTSSVGFNLFVRGNLPSLASELKAEGYETLAMHPYRGTNYRRHIVYPQIGFDTYYTREDFRQPRYIRSYISDQELADRIIEEFDKNKATGKPLFSYNVTVQNHGGYRMSNLRNLELPIEVENPEVDQDTAQIYVNLIRESDRMLENLVKHFEQEEEPTVILMFGDHQANLGEDTYRYLLGDEKTLTPEEQMEKYKIPFVIWANYDIEEETIERTSLNYLYSIMADRLGLPMTGYQRYLLALREKLPVLCAQGYWDADGEFYEVKDTESPHYADINEYQILQYNDIFGKKNRYLEFFT